jgi:hypothetical protein
MPTDDSRMKPGILQESSQGKIEGNGAIGLPFATPRWREQTPALPPEQLKPEAPPATPIVPNADPGSGELARTPADGVKGGDEEG